MRFEKLENSNSDQDMDLNLLRRANEVDRERDKNEEVGVL
jgi:hypothetical protein